ncbi:peptidase T [Aerococcus suis]|uniref:Peptidase T n=1 Tax=Aerococcus suis TaxID=371602 RepID=A0A1W1Y780_9LACT|nr:peptidase T [Aerococcus suis]MCI7240753.1 peptidase T [Aerococcus suis]MDD7758397.1 peptidase T [Aerococcus suis]MDY4646991.1 peptidase T [Aerococcus suis]SMC31985.1 tripeptide aminopeptidase [Aerococcus suis]
MYDVNTDLLLEKFLAYVKEDTQSNPDNSKSVPSSENQVVFLKKLKQSLEEMGLSSIQFNQDDAYVTAVLPSNDEDHSYPTIGFFAHVDTADFNGKNVSPQIIEDYPGGNISLGNSGYQLTPEEFPALNHYQGQTLITTDGTTLLGADDKAGIAEIVTAITYLMAHPEIKHGDIKVAFGPDEEIGIGASRFNVERFDADFAYTMDGGPLGELQFETFNGAQAKFVVTGKNVHPGTAKGTMINALQVAIDFHQALPQSDRPEKTSGREGFYHLLDLNGNVESATGEYIIRDHSREKFEERKRLFQTTADQINNEFGREVIAVSITDQYYNMGDVIKNDFRPITLAKQAFEKIGIEPDTAAVRGGTDGSTLTFNGLPTPNIFAGGENMHGRFEYVSLQTMEKAAQVIVGIVEASRDYNTL